MYLGLTIMLEREFFYCTRIFQVAVKVYEWLQFCAIFRDELRRKHIRCFNIENCFLPTLRIFRVFVFRNHAPSYLKFVRCKIQHPRKYFVGICRGWRDFLPLHASPERATANAPGAISAVSIITFPSLHRAKSFFEGGISSSADRMALKALIIRHDVQLGDRFISRENGATRRMNFHENYMPVKL